jgi:RPA family protein
MKAMQNEKFIRQPALRLFAAELAESKQTIIEHVEGRDFDSLRQLTPTGVKVKRVLMMGTLVELDNVGTSGEYLRGRIVDPTGAFNVYAGKYQPEAFLSLSNLTVPCFVAIVGKTNAYKPDEERIIVSIRPETIVEIDAKTRDHWVKETAVKTLERVEKSQISEAEKEKYRQMCKDALTKLVYMPHETSLPLHETPELSTSHQKENVPGRPNIKQPEDKILITSQASSPEELPIPEKEISKTRHVRESKESKTKPNDSIKARIRKKKIKQEPVNNSQKTLFPET